MSKAAHTGDLAASSSTGGVPAAAAAPMVADVIGEVVDRVDDPGAIVHPVVPPVAVASVEAKAKAEAKAKPEAKAKAKAKAKGGRRPRDRGERLEGEEGEEWPSFTLPGGGKLVLDPFTMSYGAHCPKHPECRINKVVSKRPIGYLTRWLDIAGDFVTAEEHTAAKMDREDGGKLSYLHRDASRTRFSALAGAEEWLNREPPPRTEPRVLR